MEALCPLCYVRGAMMHVYICSLPLTSAHLHAKQTSANTAVALSNALTHFAQAWVALQAQLRLHETYPHTCHEAGVRMGACSGFALFVSRGTLVLQKQSSAAATLQDQGIICGKEGHKLCQSQPMSL